MGGGAAGAPRGHGAGDGPLARLILDTTVLVDAERGGGALLGAIDDADDVAIAAVTVAELKVGVEMAKGRRRVKRERFVAAVLDAASIEVYDLEVAEAHAALLAHVRRAGKPRGAHDLIIAATARARGRRVLSLDRSGFADLPGVAVG
ncbi:MAG TPA: PIN domain-containing protein [Solirubrobacterales bacterium]